MNIVYVIEDYSENGGVERIVSMKANTLYREYQHQVTLISVYQDNRPHRYQLDSNIPLVLLHVPFAQKSTIPGLTTCSRLKTLMTAAVRLNKAIRKINPDVIFFATTLGALLLPFCYHKAKKIYESHLARTYNPYHVFFKWMEIKADAIICLTKDDAKEYLARNKVCVIPNFINTPQQKVIEYDSKKAIAVGRLEEQKGFDRLIRCWQQIAQEYPDWKLDIYGEGSQHEDLQRQINALNLDNQIKLCGRCENMMEIYPKYSLQVMSSHYEGQPMVLIEAQSCGLPSVVFNFKYGASDIIQNEYNGLIVAQDDENAFTEAIFRLIGNPLLRKQLGTHALEIGDKYAKSNIFKKWERLLIEL